MAWLATVRDSETGKPIARRKIHITRFDHARILAEVGWEGFVRSGAIYIGMMPVPNGTRRYRQQESLDDFIAMRRTR